MSTRTDRGLPARFPLVSTYVLTRGKPYVLAWCHRLAGLLATAYLWAHLYTLLSLRSGAAYQEKMELYRFFLFPVLEWMLAIPIIFHALNGGRLILYEIFGKRNDPMLVRWVLGLTALYCGILGVLMVLGNQAVSAFFFWLIVLAGGLSLAYGVVSRIRKTSHSIFWKLQRITAAFLLATIPAHLLFMHLNPTMAKETAVVIERMQSAFIKGVDLCLVLSALYHSGYGLISIARDYISLRVLAGGVAFLVTLWTVIFAALAVQLTLAI